MNVWRHLKHSMKIERKMLHDNQTSRDDMASSRRFISNKANMT